MTDKEIFDDKGRREWEALIDEWVHSNIDRQMLKRKYLDGITFERVAEEFEISTNYCQARIKKAKTQLFKHI